MTGWTSPTHIILLLLIALLLFARHGRDFGSSESAPGVIE